MRSNGGAWPRTSIVVTDFSIGVFLWAGRGEVHLIETVIIIIFNSINFMFNFEHLDLQLCFFGQEY